MTRAIVTQIRPGQYSWSGGIERRTVKIERTLETYEQMISAGHAPMLAENVADLGAITLACSWGYLAQRLGAREPARLGGLVGWDRRESVNERD